MKITKQKNHLLLTFLTLFMFSVSASAMEDYQYSVIGLYQNTEDDNNFEATLMMGGLAYYFKPVPSRGGPLEVVDFLNRQTNIIGAYGLVEYDFGGADIDGNAYLIGFTYADPSNPITLGVSYVDYDADDNVATSWVDIDGDQLTLSLGYYLNNHSAIGISLEQSDSEITVNGSVVGESDTDTIGLTYRILESLEDNKFLDVELGYEQYEDIDNDTNSEIMIKAAYYLDQKVGLHGGFAINSGDDSSDEGKTLTIGFSVYMSQSTGVKLDIVKFSADEGGNDEDSVSFEFEHRFN